MGMNYHNMTSLYNSHFLAADKMREVDAKILATNVDDYNKILPIYPTIKKGSIDSADLTTVIKYAAIPMELHKNSDWVDDCYILIGKARLYQGKFPLAIETFKYVNTISKDKEARHAALVQLMRTFITEGDMQSALMVSDYLRKEKVHSRNMKDLYVTRCWYFQVQEDYERALKNLKLGLPLIRKKDERSRAHFVLGQIYQMKGMDTAAYKHYRAVLRNSPPYELSFYARLFMAQVTDIEKSDNVKKIRKNFNKMLVDEKNKEYKDKIYYEMAIFELKQRNRAKCLEYLKSSAHFSAGNAFQKTKAYLKLGELYYETEDFEISKLYYDSTVAIIDKKEKNYRAVVARQKILAEFVKQLHIVEEEDSLQKLAAMSPQNLDAELEQILSDEDAARIKAEKEAEQKKKVKESQSADSAAAASSALKSLDATSKWYFANPTQITQGQTDFQTKWGNRKLEDNWRRATKDNVFNPDDEVKDSASVAAAKTAASAPVKTAEQLDAEKKAKRDARKKALMANIPFTPEQMEASMKRMEKAMYELGKIYNFKLDEPHNAIETFDRFLTTFPNSDYVPEVLYFMYLLYQKKNDDAKASYYRDKLVNEYPHSDFAKVIKNPNYLAEHRESNKKAARKYDYAYSLYTQGEYITAENTIKAIREEYPDNDLEDKLTLLGILITGKVRNVLVYKDQLDSFVVNYKKSPLMPKAKELLKASQSYISTQKDSIKINQVRYNRNTIMPHCYVASFKKAPNGDDQKLLNEFTNYLQTHKYDSTLTATQVTLSDSVMIIIVKHFSGKFTSETYMEDMKADKNFIKKIEKYPLDFFIISNFNLPLLLESKDVEAYLKFYKTYYL